MDLRVSDVSFDTQYTGDIERLHNWARVVELMRKYKRLDTDLIRLLKESVLIQAEKERVASKIEVAMNNLLGSG